MPRYDDMLQSDPESLNEQLMAMRSNDERKRMKKDLARSLSKRWFDSE